MTMSMRTAMLLALALQVFGTLTSGSTEGKAQSDICTTPIQRKAWHTLTNAEKDSYLDAEKCLMNTPTWTHEQLPVATTLFQALQEQHVLQYEHIHEVGAFLPFHRYMTYAHEQLLRTQCNYTGAQPWWDEERDAGHFANSSLFDSEHGSGGRKSGCVEVGPFANYKLIIGPGKNYTKHCLARDIDDVASQASSSFWLGFVKNATTFEEAWDRIEFYPHSAGHSGVGGEMLNPVSSPGDPMFYVHHAFVDKLWWEWQFADLETRLYAMGGPNVLDPSRPAPIPSVLPPGSEQDRRRSLKSVGKRQLVGRAVGDLGNVTTLDHGISLYGLLPNVTVRDVMDVRTELLCYNYV